MDAAPPPTALAPAPFDGKRFRNLSGRRANSFGTALRWMLTRQRVAWPRHLPNPPAAKPVPRVEEGIRATCIGHATVLLQVPGLNILTDPVWSHRVGPTSWLGPARTRDPAIPLTDIPPIDAILLSHNHYDHLNRPTLKTLVGRDNPHILIGLKAARHVPSARVTELDWGQSHTLSPTVRATFVPAEHFSARTPFDRNQTLWGGYVLQTPAGVIYFAADTAAGPHFAQIRQQFGPPLLSFLPIGAYSPRWFMGPVHMDPAQAVAASQTLQSLVSVAIHFGTFPLADDGIDEPVNELQKALEGRNLDFRVPRFGEPIEV